ncbi:hypothetical protein [Pseudomonas sp. EMN2]|uniref:hypothetical protein n=1 Tax=Pseudomonas sp. EMN2 TaxID=2615212 RepID=UPI00129AA143|nr:hypothetical protein [Pseudomonas sp. EMN2]
MKKVTKKVLNTAGVLLLTMYANYASADFKWSDIWAGWIDEFKSAGPVALGFFALCGFIYCGWSIMSAISTKKQNQPLTWQFFGVLGGALCTIIPVILIATSGSVSNGQGNTSNALSELNVNY